jgi:hypothetical protein
MMQGVPANVFIYKGQVNARATVLEGSFESAKGDPSSAVLTKYGISVRGPDETRMLGLWRKGGWGLTGGLLARFSARTELVDLYGKEVLWEAPYFPLPFHRAPPERHFSYEFFLLQRNRTTMRAQLLRKWVFEPPEVIITRQFGFPAAETVWAELKYEPTTRTATVTVHGLAHPFQEAVQVPAPKP